MPTSRDRFLTRRIKTFSSAGLKAKRFLIFPFCRTHRYHILPCIINQPFQSFLLLFQFRFVELLVAAKTQTKRQTRNRFQKFCALYFGWGNRKMFLVHHFVNFLRLPASRTRKTLLTECRTWISVRLTFFLFQTVRKREKTQRVSFPSLIDFAIEK